MNEKPRHLWTLEKRDLLGNIQRGLRIHRSTTDHLMFLSTRISNSFPLWEHLVAAFFNLKKAYDTTWTYRILRTLHSCGFRSSLPLFIEQFLSNRSFRVKLGKTYSEECILENGIPQGSILSGTLFAIAITALSATFDHKYQHRFLWIILLSSSFHSATKWLKDNYS